MPFGITIPIDSKFDQRVNDGEAPQAVSYGLRVLVVPLQKLELALALLGNRRLMSADHVLVVLHHGLGVSDGQAAAWPNYLHANRVLNSTGRFR